MSGDPSFKMPTTRELELNTLATRLDMRPEDRAKLVSAQRVVPTIFEALKSLVQLAESHPSMRKRMNLSWRIPEGAEHLQSINDAGRRVEMPHYDYRPMLSFSARTSNPETMPLLRYTVQYGFVTHCNLCEFTQERICTDADGSEMRRSALKEASRPAAN